MLVDGNGIADLEAIAGLPEKEVSLGKALLLASSIGEKDLYGISVDPSGIEEKIEGLVARVRPALKDRSNPRSAVSLLSRFLFVEEGFVYDPAAGNPENYLPDHVLSRKRGNCLGLTMLYLVLAERLGIPLQGSYVPSHSFVRYEGQGGRINIETAEKGVERADEQYARDFLLAKDRPYLRTLGKKEMIGVYLKSLGAAYSRNGIEEKAAELYRAAAEFDPNLPDVHFNMAISDQKMGRLEEAIAGYRRAIALDGDLAAARDNLAVALAKKGRLAEALVEARKAVDLDPRNVIARGNLAAILCACGKSEDGIREFRKVLEIQPGNVKALAGLAKAYYSREKYRDVVEYSDRDGRAGVRLDDAMPGALE